MKEKNQSKIKDININLINNYNSDITKHQIPVRNLNSNINPNSYSQENIFNELINSINCQESKNNSSFSESINSNMENQNIIMNKDQLYHIFILFQRLINQNPNIKNNTINIKNEESTNNTNNTYINNISRNKNIIGDFYENQSNNMNRKSSKDNISQYLKKNKSDTNIIGQKEEFKNVSKKKEIKNKIIENKNNKKNPYDDIPIKLNTINFLELVEKKLADEEKNMKKPNNKNKNYIKKIINKAKKDKIRNKNMVNNNLIIKEERMNTYRESINKPGGKAILNRDKNKLANYSFDKEETKIIYPENKNTIENNTSIIDNMNTIFIKGESPKKKIINFQISNFNFELKCENKSIEEVVEKCNEKEHLFNKKIKELNKEIIKLKEEQNKINKIKLEYEKCMAKLNNDIYQFGQKKEEFEKFRKNELLKIKSNKKNIIVESKNMKEIKIKNQELINKSKKDKEIIEQLKQQINKLQNNLNIHVIKERRFKSPDGRKQKNLSESKTNLMKRINTQYKTNTHKLIEENNITNINNDNNNNNNNILSNSIDFKNIKEKRNISLRRNNLTNKNLLPKENEIVNEIYKRTAQNESSTNLSISQKIFDNLNNNLKPKKENKNEILLFSPVTCKTSVGFGLRKISIKLNNTPKANIRKQKKIYENKHFENQVLNTYSDEKEDTNKNAIINNTNENTINNFTKINQIKNNLKKDNNNEVNNIFLPENKKKFNVKLKKKKKMKTEILNFSANNDKNGMKNKIINKKINFNKKEDYDFTIPKKYLNKEYKLIKTIKENDKIINIYSNDKKEILFNNGIKKEIFKNEHQIIYFTNGDIKQIFSDGKVSYFYNDSKNVETTLNNGTKIYKLKNGQIEKHFPDGTKLIIFNDETEKYIYNDGSEETYFSDGFVQKDKDKDKDIIIEKTLEEDN